MYYISYDIIDHFLNSLCFFETHLASVLSYKIEELNQTNFMHDNVMNKNNKIKLCELD